MSTSADKKILELADPGYIKKIPSFVRSHPTGNTCRLIERNFQKFMQNLKRSRYRLKPKTRCERLETIYLKNG